VEIEEQEIWAIHWVDDPCDDCTHWIGRIWRNYLHGIINK